MINQKKYEFGDIEKELKKGILAWYNFRVNTHVLCIGESESIHELLNDRELTFNAFRLSETITDEFILRNKAGFDYIIAIAELENTTNPREILIKWRLLLKDNGILLLATDNRLGIRYICGDQDPFTGKCFDGLENYARYNRRDLKTLQGRCYAEYEWKEMLEQAGFYKHKSYSVLPDYESTQLIYAEDYLPNEELSMRYIPMYRHPDTVFLHEGLVYNTLISSGLFHKMANSYLFECALDGKYSNVKHVTLSMDRGREAAFATIIKENEVVEKRPVYPEGYKSIENLLDNENYLGKRGIALVKSEMIDGIYSMPYVRAVVGNKYLQDLMIENKDSFIAKMDEFCQIILKSSEHVGNNEYGIILKRGYVDLVPLNCFYLNDTFVFYDQEFYFENYPADIIIYRTLLIVYDNDPTRNSILPIQFFIERYNLVDKQSYLMEKAVEFTRNLRHQIDLQSFNDRHLCLPQLICKNREKVEHIAFYEKEYVSTCFRGAKDKKVLIFGSGRYADQFMAFYSKDLNIECILDNNPEKWGKEFWQKKIVSINFLYSLNLDEYKVIVCVKQYETIIRQLIRIGVSNIGIYDIDYAYLERPCYPKPSSSTTTKKYHVGYVSGVFDLFHIGHINMLRRAKEQCDYLIVAVTSDEYVRTRKKKEPFIPFEERLEVVNSCKFVDEAVGIPIKYAGTIEAFHKYHFNVQFCGSDYINDPWWLEQKAWLEAHGATLEFFSYTEETSSTKIKSLIEQKLL